MRAVAIALVLGVSFADQASAEEVWVCDAAQNNVEHIACADREFKKHDAELNRLYQALMKKADPSVPGYGPPPSIALRDAQRLWVVYREKNCHWKSTSFYGGTGQGVIAASCRAIATRERVEELKAFVE